jgi:tol-pal system protein YbgF
LAARLQAQISDLSREVDDLKNKTNDLTDQFRTHQNYYERVVKDLTERLQMIEAKKSGRPYVKPPIQAPAPEHSAGPTMDAHTSLDDSHIQPGSLDTIDSHIPSATGGYDPNPSHTLGTLGAQDSYQTAATPLPADGTLIGRDFNQGKPAATVAPQEEAAQPKSLTPLEKYAKAEDFLQNQQYAEAIEAFKTYLKSHSKDGKAPEAQFGMGESFFAQKNYGSAAKSYLEGYQKYKTTKKGPDFLFKLGQSLSRLNKKPEACKSYGKLLKEYPKASAVLKKRVKEEQKKLQCKA